MARVPCLRPVGAVFLYAAPGVCTGDEVEWREVRAVQHAYIYVTGLHLGVMLLRSVSVVADSEDYCWVYSPFCLRMCASLTSWLSEVKPVIQEYFGFITGHRWRDRLLRSGQSLCT